MQIRAVNKMGGKDIIAKLREKAKIKLRPKKPVNYKNVA